MESLAYSATQTIMQSEFGGKSGIQMGDIISNFKIENPERPNKAIVYPFALIFLLIVGYLNYRRKT